MSHVDGIGFAIGPPAPARLTIGLAKTEVGNKLKTEILRCILPLYALLDYLLNVVLVTRR